MSTRTEQALLGGGCFWCIEAVYQRVEGIVDVVSGYAGGSGEKPTYEEVCTGSTGFAEVVQLTFDPEKVSYREILDIFWQVHDPTTPNRQGNDVGTQYRSVIMWQNATQREEARRSKEEAQARFSVSLVTEIVPATVFHRAEPYHQNYYNDHSLQPYCSLVIRPKLRKLGMR